MADVDVAVDKLLQEVDEFDEKTADFLTVFGAIGLSQQKRVHTHTKSLIQKNKQ